MKKFIKKKQKFCVYNEFICILFSIQINKFNNFQLENILNDISIIYKKFIKNYLNIHIFIQHNNINIV